MRKQQAVWILLAILALGLANLGIILFRGVFIKETDEASVRLWGPKAYAQSLPKYQPAAQRPAVAPDGVTGATPRIIALQLDALAQQLRPAVVGIRAGTGAVAPLWQQGWNAPTTPAGWSVGSGVVVHPAGYIITNRHVIDSGGVVQVTVFFPTGTQEYTARILAVDQARDLALLKIDPGAPLVSMPIGDSDLVRTGDYVLGIGNPFGLSQSVTKGIVSARERSLLIGNQQMTGLFQTDVPINPGNSGGALCNFRGELVGINVAIYSPVESVYTGVSFAIPINSVKKVYGNYMDFTTQPMDLRWPGTLGLQPRWQARNVANVNPRFDTANPARIPAAQRIMPSPGEGIEELAWLGIDLTPSMAGVEVDEIEGITPMEAGLQAGDIVKKVNNFPTPDMYAFKDAIKQVPLKVGQGVVLDVFRPRSNRSMYINFRLKKWDLRGR